MTIFATEKVIVDLPENTDPDVVYYVRNGTGFDIYVTDGSGTPFKANGDGKAIFPIWAEENGGLANNAYEWSWGNGSVGNDIGIPVALDCELFAVSFNADVFGTQISVRTQGNASVLFEATFTNNNQVVDLASPVFVSKGTRVDFRTGTLSGTFTDARVCAWFRQV